MFWKRATEGIPDGHVNVQRGEEDFTDGPRRVGAFYKSEDPGAELSTYRKGMVRARRCWEPSDVRRNGGRPWRRRLVVHYAPQI